MVATARSISPDIYAETLNGHPSYKKYKTAEKELSYLGLHLITLKELVSLMNHGKIKIYDKNRGTVGLIDSHIDRIVDNFDFTSLGMIPMVHTDDGLVTVDGSHRMTALCKLAVQGLLEPYWHEEIPVRIVKEDEKIRNYMNINSGIRHTKINTLTNDSLPYGKMISQIVKLAQTQTKLKVEIPARHYNCIATLIFAVQNNLLLCDEYLYNWSWENVSYQNSSLCRKDIIRPEPQINELSLSDCAPLVDGVAVVLEYLDKLAKHKKTVDKDLKKTIHDSKTRARTIKEAFPTSLLASSVIGYLMCAGSRKEYQLKHVDEFWEAIYSHATTIGNKMDMKQGMNSKAKLSKYLDNIIFGKQMKADRIRYFPKQ